MAIKCYLYSNRTRQINHKYYSLSTDRDVRLFLDLKQDTAYFGKIENKAFVYEVEVYLETIFICSDKYLQARKYKIVRYISVFEYLNEIDLPGDFLNEIAEIALRSTSGSLKHDFYNLFNQAPSQLSPYEKLKFLAILNLAQECLPNIIIEKPYQVNYIKFFEFYRISYKLSINISSQEARREKYLEIRTLKPSIIRQRNFFKEFEMTVLV